MPIRPPRRIFRSSFRVPRLPRAVGFAAVGVLCAGSAAVGLAALGPRLLGQTPVTSARISAGPADVAVVDGETLRVSGVVVRLAGVSAPARGDQCRPGLDCGGAASSSLASLVRDRFVRCDLEDTGRARPVGSCFAGPEDLSRGVVERGWARADRADLRESEQEARNARRGLWATP